MSAWARFWMPPVQPGLPPMYTTNRSPAASGCVINPDARGLTACLPAWLSCRKSVLDEQDVDHRQQVHSSRLYFCASVLAACTRAGMCCCCRVLTWRWWGGSSLCPIQMRISLLENALKSCEQATPQACRRLQLILGAARVALWRFGARVST